MPIEQTISTSETNSRKTRLQRSNLFFNHRISFDTKGHISPLSEENSYIMVIVDACTHYVTLNPVPHCNFYYSYTTLYEHWIAKLELAKIIVTDNGTELINNEITASSHLHISCYMLQELHKINVNLPRKQFVTTYQNIRMTKIISNIHKF